MRYAGHWAQHSNYNNGSTCECGGGIHAARKEPTYHVILSGAKNLARHPCHSERSEESRWSRTDSSLHSE